MFHITILSVSISILLAPPVSSNITKEDIEGMIHLITTVTGMNNDSLTDLRTINDGWKAVKTVREVSDDMRILIYKYSRLLDEIFPSTLSPLSQWARIETTTTEDTKVENAILKEDITLESPKDRTPKDGTPEKELVRRGNQSNAPKEEHVDDAVIETTTSAMDTFFNWLSSHIDENTDNISTEETEVP